MLGSAPWRRAPVLLLRRPGVFAAVFGAVLVLGVAAASAPLFLTSSANASLHQQIDDSCGSTVGPTYEVDVPFRQVAFDPERPSRIPPTLVGAQLLDLRQGQVASATRGVPRVHQVTTLDFLTKVQGAPENGADTVRIVSRTGFRDHVDVLRQVAGDGAYISDRGARDFGIEAGDTLPLAGTGGQASVRIKGVYRDLREGAAYAADYWCQLTGDFYQNPYTLTPPPVFDVLLADLPTALTVAERTGAEATGLFTSFVDVAGITTDRTTAVVTGIDRQRDALVGGGAPRDQPFRSLDPPPGQLAHFLQRAILVQSALTSTVTPIAVAGCVVALLVVGAAAVYWVERRRVEVDVLVAHGVGPTALGAKALLEMAPAALLGAAAGWAVALGLVRLVGPSALLSAGRPLQALEVAAAALAVALLLLGLVAGVRVRSTAERAIGLRRRWPALVPWELAVLAGAGVAVGRLVGGSSQTDALGLGSVAHVDPLLLVFPLLFFVGAVTFVGRLLAAGTLTLRRRGDRLPNVPYLALRRITGAPLVAVLLVSAAALPAAVALYGASVSASVRTTLQTEARLHIGSDVVLLLTEPAPMPAGWRGHSTEVLRYPGEPLGDLRVDVIGVDVRTFADAAYADPTLSPSLQRQLQRVTSGSEGLPPALLVGANLHGPQTLLISQLSAPAIRVPVDIVGHPADFPSEGRSGPLLVVDRKALAGLPGAWHELWVRGDEQQIQRQAAQAALPIRFPFRASAVVDKGVYLPVSYTFDYLTALAVLAATVGLGGLLLYLESRSRARRLSYVMVRRMGMSRAGHLAGVALELAACLGVGLVVGLGLALAAVHAVAGPLDLDPTTPPATVLVTPYAALGVVALVVAVAVVTASLFAQRSLDRADPAEVLRDA